MTDETQHEQINEWPVAGEDAAVAAPASTTGTGEVAERLAASEGARAEAARATRETMAAMPPEEGPGAAGPSLAAPAGVAPAPAANLKGSPGGAPTAEEAKADEKAAAGRQTEYVILRRRSVRAYDPDESDHEFAAWAQVGSATGAPKGAVLREFVGGLPADEQDGAFKAVAASAWKGGLSAKPPTGPVFVPLED